MQIIFLFLFIIFVQEGEVVLCEGQEDLFLEPAGFILIIPLLQVEIMSFLLLLLVEVGVEVEGQFSWQEVEDYALQVEQTSFMALGAVIIQHLLTLAIIIF